MRVPKLLHYIFGMPGVGSKPWSLSHHVCVASAIDRIKPDEARFYYEEEPTGPWWALTKSLVTRVQVKAPREVFGRPLLHVAHQADILRLQKLIESGGIYLDVDVLVHRSFDDLLKHSVCMGRETAGGTDGLTNAVIVAEPNAPFLKRWFAGYETFRSRGRDRYWSEHSVELPLRLAGLHPDEITLLGPRAFFWPSWTRRDIDRLFNSAKPILMDNEVYANHLWESQAWDFLAGLTPGEVRARNTNFHIWARPFLEHLPDDYGASDLTRKYKARRFARSLPPARAAQILISQITGR